MTDGGYNPNGILNPVHEARKTMTAPLCICGHGKERHTGMSGDDRYCKEWVQREKWTSHCPCANYRPVLDWPDAPGLWWCSTRSSGFVFFTDTMIRNRCKHWAIDGPARFVRVLEQNPFGEK